MGHNPFPSSNLDDPDYHDHPSDTGELARPGNLDAAWKAAEAWLPVPGRVCVQGRGEGQYEAWAQAAQEHGWRSLGFGYGDTPAKALRELVRLAVQHTEEPRCADCGPYAPCPRHGDDSEYHEHVAGDKHSHAFSGPHSHGGVSALRYPVQHTEEEE